MWMFSTSLSAQRTLIASAATSTTLPPNLDMVLELRNAAGGSIASPTLRNTLGAQIVESLIPGDYFVAVTKTSTYGWVGQYNVTIDTPAADITVTPISVPLTTGEDGTAATFDVALYTRPTDDVTIALSSSDPTEGSLSDSSLTFTPANWKRAANGHGHGCG